MAVDKSRGYERIAPEYISGRGSNRSGKGVGASTVAAWAGGSFRSIAPELRRTRAMEDAFLKTPDHLEIEAGPRRVELLVPGADPPPSKQF